MMGKKSKDKDRKKTISCGTIAWRVKEGKKQILLIKQFAKKDSWGAPKGHINEKESFEQCAIRETKEETGIDVVLGERLPDVSICYKNEDKTVVTYIATPVSSSQEPDHSHEESEVADAQWFDIDSIPQIFLYQQPLVKCVVDFLEKKLLCNWMTK